MASITRRGNTYRIRVSNGYDATGKQCTFSMTYKPDQGMTQRQIERELNDVAHRFEDKILNGSTSNDRIRFCEFAAEWMHRHCERKLAPKTISEYKKLLERVNAAFGHVRLCDIKHVTLQRFFDELESSPNLKDTSKQLSPNTVMHYYRLLSSMFNAAIRWGYFENSPLRRIEPPSVEHKEARCYDIEEAQALINALNTDSAEPGNDRFQQMQYRTAIYILLFMGLRRGELLGLEWSDISTDTKKMSIARSSQYIPKQGMITKAPKNKTSIRTIEMPAQLLPLLQEYRQAQEEYAASIGDKWNQTGRLFTTWDGKPMHPDSLHNWFAAFLKRHELPYINIHGLRHTSATLAIVGAGTDIRTVSRRLGHATPTTTMNIYSHALQSSDTAAAEAMDKLLART